MSNQQLRSRCRNPHCRLKLPYPVENKHHAFCCRGCFESFYLNRCRVCEDPMQRKREGQKFKSGHKTCEVEYRRFPRVYDYNPDSPLPPYTNSDESLGSADSTGLKSAHEGDRPPFRCLAHWWWGGDPENGDHSLYDAEGLTVARIVLAGGRYHLRSPLAWLRQSWSDLDEAKRRSEAIALSALPLDSRTAANVRRFNEAEHPMMKRKFPVQPERPAAAVAAENGPRDEPGGPDESVIEETI
jgi:hypothetical protein